MIYWPTRIATLTDNTRLPLMRVQMVQAHCTTQTSTLRPLGKQPLPCKQNQGTGTIAGANTIIITSGSIITIFNINTEPHYLEFFSDVR